MALIRCPECGREISDKAKCCIHCGYPLEELGIQAADDREGRDAEPEWDAEPERSAELDGYAEEETDAAETWAAADADDGFDERDLPNPEDRTTMIQCPACGKTISSKSYNCPECGHPINEQDSGTSFLVVLVAVIAGILICAIF